MKHARLSLKLALPLSMALLASTALTRPLLAGSAAQAVSGPNVTLGNGDRNAADAAYRETGQQRGAFPQYRSDHEPGTVMVVTSHDTRGYEVAVVAIDGNLGGPHGGRGGGPASNNDGDGGDEPPQTPQQSNDGSSTQPGAGGPSSGTDDDGTEDPSTAGNQKPNDNNHGSDLVWHGKATMRVTWSLKGSSLGGWLDQQGFGPRGNPGDQDNGSGPSSAPTDGSNGLSQRQLASLYQLENAVERALARSGEDSGSTGASSDNTRGSGTGNVGTHPVVVKPVSRTPKVSASNGVSRAMQPGLLDGGSGSMPGNGPSATGSPVIGGRGAAGPAAIR